MTSASLPLSSSIDLHGRRIAVTGAGGGIGAATARRLVEAGARVALIDRDGGSIRTIANELGMPAFVCDVTDESAVALAARAIEESLGGTDGLVNAAGILLQKTVEDMSAGEWVRVTNVNLLGPFLTCKAFAPVLKRAGGGTIVNISSIGGLRPARGVAAYTASKAGLLMLGKCLAIELAPSVRVNAICPGTVDTPMVEKLLSDSIARDRLEAGTALGRLATPVDVANAVVFLSSPLSAYINGASLIVDGGFSWA